MTTRFSTKSIVIHIRMKSIDFVTHETNRYLLFIMNLMQSVVIVYSYFIVVQAVENIETTITLHEEYQSDLIDVCSKYKHGSWLTV